MRRAFVVTTSILFTVFVATVVYATSVRTGSFQVSLDQDPEFEADGSYNISVEAQDLDGSWLDSWHTYNITNDGPMCFDFNVLGWSEVWDGTTHVQDEDGDTSSGPDQQEICDGSTLAGSFGNARWMEGIDTGNYTQKAITSLQIEHWTNAQKGWLIYEATETLGIDWVNPN